MTPEPLPGYDTWKTTPPERRFRKRHDPDAEYECEKNGDMEA
jgi:hypothetical protein